MTEYVYNVMYDGFVQSGPYKTEIAAERAIRYNSSMPILVDVMMDDDDVLRAFREAKERAEREYAKYTIKKVAILE